MRLFYWGWNEVVWMWVTLSSMVKLCQICDVNCGPQIDVIVCGRLKHKIHWVHSASAHAVAVVEVRGAASPQRVVPSMMRRMWVWPWEWGRGPEWKWEKEECGFGYESLWQEMHSLDHLLTSVAKEGHTNREEIIRRWHGCPDDPGSAL
jgi:hypothetical protein